MVVTQTSYDIAIEYCYQQLAEILRQAKFTNALLLWIGLKAVGPPVEPPDIGPLIDPTL